MSTRSNEVFVVLGIVALLVIVIIGIAKAWEYEEKNKVPVWVDYEVKRDSTHVILYKVINPSDSIVFRPVQYLGGHEVVQKLEYRLP